MQILFFTLLLIALLTYALWHVWAIVPLPHWAKWCIVAIALLCFAMEFIGFTPLMHRLPLGVSSLIYNIGNKSLIIILYLIIAFLLLDVGRLVHIVPRSLLHDSLPATACITVLLGVVFVCGSIHYHNKQRVELSADSRGKLPQPVKVVMASDLHIGYHNRRSDLSKWIELVNAEKPDLVLFAGDILDYSMRPVLEEGMAEEFRRIEAPTYACLGNHEYYSGLNDAIQFYADAGINLLRDSSVTFRNMTIIGRDDRTNPDRRTLAELKGEEKNYTILLDHQPYNLEEAEKAGIDFQFSGHTHNGQVWPLTLIIKHMYECAWGSHQRGATQYYVTSGLGIWGAKYRIGSQSEYIVLTIK